MNKVAFHSLFLIALILALGLRLGRLDLRPMHHDEANQAVKFGTLLETGEYRYDRSDHHGPTLYYATLPFAWIRGQKTLSALDEWTLRAVPVVFGAGLILLFGLLAKGLGREAVFWSALFAALSPSLVYYNRFYIQESLFVFFALGFLIALGRFALRPSMGLALAVGVSAGFAYATKETSLLVFVSAGTALVLALVWTRGTSRVVRVDTCGRGIRISQLLTLLAAAVFIAGILYSSFFKNPWGIVDSVTAFKDYATRGIETGLHSHPWFYYFQLLAFSRPGGILWSEALILVFALFGAIASFGSGLAHRNLQWHDFTDGQFWPRYLFCYSLVTAIAFSVIRYKTPWNLLPFHIGFILLAGSGVAALLQILRVNLVRKLLMLVILAGVVHLGIQSWRANYLYPADTRNPYVYAQTSTDFLRLARRVHDLANVHADGKNLLIKVIAGPYEQWPLPWYLRDFSRLGYWINQGESGGFEGVPLIIASQENAAPLEKALGDRYQIEYYGLRPDVLLTLFIDRQLWDQYLSRK